MCYILYILGTNHLRPVSHDNIEFAFQQTNSQTISGSEDFDDYAERVWTTLQLPIAQKWQDALDNYFILRTVAVYGL